MINEEFLAAVDGQRVRLEFGLQTIHSNEGKAVRRFNNMRLVDEALMKVISLGLPFEVSLIFGLPDQTLESFEDSVRHCLDLGVPTIKAFPLMLLRGTDLERDRDDWGLVENDELIPAVVASNSFGPAEQRRMAALSEALRCTEGAHPSFEKLQHLATGLASEPGRFSPRSARGVVG